jgi:uncharacterized lipoprotein YddW (UPF0748 family)/predicted DNA-binding WGR domain protein
MSEIRGIWLTLTDSRVLFSRENITEAIDFLADTGFNVVFPVVWKNAATLYPSQVMREFGIEIDPQFRERDPLAELIAAAKPARIAVIPWFEYGFASSYNSNGGRIIAQKPTWAARDSSGNLLKKGGFEWLNPFNPEVQDFLVRLVLEVVRNYDIAGIQGDDRLPALPSEGGYDEITVARYQQQFNQAPPQHPKDPQWLQWRADLLTRWLERLYRDVIAFKPNLLISSAPSPYPWGLQEYLQDSKAWSDQGLFDLLHPQFYRRDFDSYRSLVDRLLSQQLLPEQVRQVAPGVLLKVGSYHMSQEHLLQTIAYNRSRGIPGEVFFFYEGLRADNSALAKALKAGPYAQPAPFDAAAIKARGFTDRRLSGKYSLIDTSGREVSQPLFDWVEPFTDGLAPVKLGYKWGYINSLGTLVTRLQFDEAAPFAEDLALVRVGDRYGYIDRQGQWVIAPQFEAAQSFREGLAQIRIGSVYGYINKTGAAVIRPQFAEATAFSEGFAAVQSAAKWGYVDATGAQVIASIFDVALPFAEGLAVVKVSNRYGYIDRRGTAVIPPRYAQAQSFSAGLAAVQLTSRWGYIDATGKQIIPPEFDEAKPFTAGLAIVKVGNQYGYIRKPTV